MTRCTKCILTDEVPGTIINQEGVCNRCENRKVFKPIGEKHLIAYFEKTKRKNRAYDVLVPFSGGKDSTYILYLATKVYKLNVLTYTYDNGFFSELALQNIKRAVEKVSVDHIFIHPSLGLLKNIYRQALVKSGEICGVCGIGIMNSMLKMSETYKIPLILLGHSPLEDDSFTPENIYDTVRLKHILTNAKGITKADIRRFLIYQRQNYFSNYFFTKTGRFGKKVDPLFFIDNPTDEEMGKIIQQEMDWEDHSGSGYTKHFDCLAEPFTNYIREQRFGYSRRIVQLSTMVRNGEITREQALDIHDRDNLKNNPPNIDLIKKMLDLTEQDVNEIGKIKPMVYEDKVSKANKIFARLREFIK
ncbi:MAG: 7-cyano-7-deazaguanine synthase [Bacteroidetes bacterium]|nr:7-cyano-7-deazaguanine synthase [Bacteroidota bacterium]MBL7102741.1 7-cyano-7-deazaguanine synthase [Bacteroidales bacterium]